MSLSAAGVALIRDALRMAGHGERAQAVRRIAAAYGVSPATLYRAVRVGGTGRPRAVRRPEYRDWVRLAVRIAHRAPKPVPLDLAIRAGVETGVLPAEAARMPLATARRIARELGLVEGPKRTFPLHADYPMQAVLVDWSSSEHLVAERPEGEDWVLKLYRRPWSASGYKNKPLKAHRMRVGVYALWDMCTGYTVARYAVERGESAHAAMEFLCWALGEAADEDPRIVLHGTPDDLWSDLGPLSRSDAARDLLKRIRITFVPGEAYAKERMGGVERSHRTRWARFERTLFLRRGQEIRLSALNARLVEYTIEENGRRLSRTPVPGQPRASRTAAWVTLVAARTKPLRALPDRPMETMAHEARRWVDGQGLVRWNGLYEAGGGWHSRWVTAYRAVDGSGDLALVDEATGAKGTAREYAPRPYGAVRTAPKTALDRCLEAGAPDVDADVWAPADRTGIARLPVRTAPAAPLASPLDTDRLADLGEAMRLFQSLHPWPLSAGNRALVIERIEASGLSRRAVTELAQTLTMIAGAGAG